MSKILLLVFGICVIVTLADPETSELFNRLPRTNRNEDKCYDENGRPQVCLGYFYISRLNPRCFYPNYFSDLMFRYESRFIYSFVSMIFNIFPSLFHPIVVVCCYYSDPRLDRLIRSMRILYYSPL